MPSMVLSTSALAAAPGGREPVAAIGFIETDVLGGLPVAALVISASVLAVCVMLMSRAMVDLPMWRRRRWMSTRAEIVDDRLLRRRAVTGARPALLDAPGPELAGHARRAITGPARQIAPRPDALTQDIVAAERTIEHLLETAPDLVAGIIMQWLEADQQSTEHGLR